MCVNKFCTQKSHFSRVLLCNNYPQTVLYQDITVLITFYNFAKLFHQRILRLRTVHVCSIFLPLHAFCWTNPSAHTPKCCISFDSSESACICDTLSLERYFVKLRRDSDELRASPPPLLDDQGSLAKSWLNILCSRL